MRRSGQEAVTLKAVAPQVQTGNGTINGSGIDIEAGGYSNATLVVETGAATGSPTTVAIAVDIQSSSDDSSYTDVTGYTSVIAIANAAHGDYNFNIPAVTTTRYMRAQVNVTFTGGTSPTVPVAASWVLFGGFANSPK